MRETKKVREKGRERGKVERKERKQEWKKPVEDRGHRRKIL